MAVLALYVPGHSVRAVGLWMLVVVVLVAAGAAVAYFLGREYVKIGRRASEREQSLRQLSMLGLSIIGVIALVGYYLK